MPTIEKLQKDFGFDFEGCNFSVVTYKGSQDADAYRWFTVGLHPEINSRLTMTEFVKSKNAVYDFGRYDVDVVLIDEDNQHPKRWTEPNFH